MSEVVSNNGVHTISESIVEPSEQPSANNRQKYNHRRKLGVIRSMLKEFSQRSTIHGVSYLGDQKLHRFELFCWIFLMLASIIGSTLFIHRMYEKWNDNPVIVSFATKPTSVWDIPFPAITICPQKKIRPKFLNTTEIIFDLYKFRRLTAEELMFMEIHYQILEWVLTNPTKGLTSNNLTNLMKEVAPSLKKTILVCGLNWNTCSTSGRTIITANGVCFTINLLNPHELYRDGIIHNDDESQKIEKSEWTRDSGFSGEDWLSIRISLNPYRSFHHPNVDGMTVTLQNYKEFVKGKKPQDTAYTFLLHAPDEVPNFHTRTYQHSIREIKKANVLITPSMITTANELRSYAPERRSCYYTNERYLKFFKIYTENNCELECLTNFTLSYCGCVKFSMPRVAETDICGIAKIYCVREASMIYYAPNSKNATTMGTISNCNCLPSCTQITYNADISPAINNFNPPTPYFGLQISYKSPTFEAAVRSENFGLSDFIACCGGLLGLFMGVSLLSILEIFYFFTIRLFVNFNKK